MQAYIQIRGTYLIGIRHVVRNRGNGTVKFSLPNTGSLMRRVIIFPFCETF
jgi:hypothetical protein